MKFAFLQSITVNMERLQQMLKYVHELRITILYTEDKESYETFPCLRFFIQYQ